MTNIQIKQVKDVDLDGCYNVEKRCYTTEGATKENIKKRINIFPQGFLVAKSNNETIGIINGTSTDQEDLSDEELKAMFKFSKKGDNIIIFSVAVLPEYQGRGVARLLLEEFIKKCKELKKEKILLMCKKELVPLYKRFGFVYIQKSKSTHGGIEWYEMRLMLD